MFFQTTNPSKKLFEFKIHKQVVLQVWKLLSLAIDRDHAAAQ